MENFDKKKHWEEVYNTKALTEVSWYQPKPEASLSFIAKYNISKNAKIIDIGGGDSFFVDHLLALDFTNITVLDISEQALKRAQKRLGYKSNQVNWIVSDVLDFIPLETYDFWHDRAAFHFLTQEKDKDTYINTAYKSLSDQGILVIGAFSESGPKKCSGISVSQYSEQRMETKFKSYFNKIDCFTETHTTPFTTTQDFIFCSFTKQ